LSKDQAVKLTVKALLEVVQAGANHLEIAVMASDHQLQLLELSEIESVVAEIEAEKEAEAEKKRTGGL